MPPRWAYSPVSRTVLGAQKAVGLQPERQFVQSARHCRARRRSSRAAISARGGTRCSRQSIVVVTTRGRSIGGFRARQPRERRHAPRATWRRWARRDRRAGSPSRGCRGFRRPDRRSARPRETRRAGGVARDMHEDRRRPFRLAAPARGRDRRRRRRRNRPGHGRKRVFRLCRDAPARSRDRRPPRAAPRALCAMLNGSARHARESGDHAQTAACRASAGGRLGAAESQAKATIVGQIEQRLQFVEFVGAQRVDARIDEAPHDDVHLPHSATPGANADTAAGNVEIVQNSILGGFAGHEGFLSECGPLRPIAAKAATSPRPLHARRLKPGARERKASGYHRPASRGNALTLRIVCPIRHTSRDALAGE